MADPSGNITTTTFPGMGEYATYNRVLSSAISAATVSRDLTTLAFVVKNSSDTGRPDSVAVFGAKDLAQIGQTISDLVTGMPTWGTPTCLALSPNGKSVAIGFPGWSATPQSNKSGMIVVATICGTEWTFVCSVTGDNISPNKTGNLGTSLCFADGMGKLVFGATADLSGTTVNPGVPYYNAYIASGVLSAVSATVCDEFGTKYDSAHKTMLTGFPANPALPSVNVGWYSCSDEEGKVLAFTDPIRRRLYVFSSDTFPSSAVGGYNGFCTMHENAEATVGPVALSNNGVVVLVGTAATVPGPSADEAGYIFGFSSATSVLNNQSIIGATPDINLPLPKGGFSVTQLVISNDMTHVAANVSDLGSIIVFVFASSTQVTSSVANSICVPYAGQPTFNPFLGGNAGLAFLDDAGTTLMVTSPGGGTDPVIGKGGAIIFQAASVADPTLFTEPVLAMIAIALFATFILIGATISIVIYEIFVSGVRKRRESLFASTLAAYANR